MKESVGYTVTLNIAIVFITIVIFFLTASVIYFKSNKVNNLLIYSIEKYEGYNQLSHNEISRTLDSIGYNVGNINCGTTKDGCNAVSDLAGNLYNTGSSGYCVYKCIDPDDDKKYYYKVRTNMVLNIPIINNLLNLPIYSNTNTLYDFEKLFEEA